MKRRTAVALVVAAGLATAARAELVEFNLVLEGSQEVPPNNSNSAGAAQLVYDTATQTYDLDLIVFGIALNDLLGVGPNQTPVHIHVAPVGQNGPIVVDVGYVSPFFQDGPAIRLQAQDAPFGGQQGGVFSDPAQNQANLFAGNLYLNIHTKEYPAGEIRGQLVPEPTSLALLLGGLLFLTRWARAR